MHEPLYYRETNEETNPGRHLDIVSEYSQWSFLISDISADFMISFDALRMLRDEACLVNAEILQESTCAPQKCPAALRTRSRRKLKKCPELDFQP